MLADLHGRWRVLGGVLDILGRLRHTKQLVHLLETEALGLGDEEPDKDAHDPAEAAEEEEHALSMVSQQGCLLSQVQLLWTYIASRAHGDLHRQDSPRNDKVEEPLRRGAHGHVQGAEPRSRDLANQDPAYGAPSELEEDSPQVDEDDGEVSEARDLRGVGLANRPSGTAGT